MDIKQFSDQLNVWGQNKVPFLFLVDFEMKKPMAFRLDEVDPLTLLFSINGFTNTVNENVKVAKPKLNRAPEPFEIYLQRFNSVYNHLSYGDSFLTNLTIKTRIGVQDTLKNLYWNCHAKYKIWFNDQFLVFSPETFIQIRDSKIYTYPMKGTIDAGIPNASDRILNDQKEKAEHITIVDLLRNDLSRVATQVRVTRFRYIEELKTDQKNLLQVSSEIAGNLDGDYLSRIGEIILSLLPAGSVSGAPKPKTLEIIREAEGEVRGYYSGVFGYFDGANLDSGVMIRYIEKAGEQFFYRSGGGITTQSKVELEYQEALYKIYVPVN